MQSLNLVFVYGALRSGTTVFRLMLDHHPRLSNPGELDFLFDYLNPDPSHPTGWRYDLAGLRLDRIYRTWGFPIAEGRDGLDLLDDFLKTLHARTPLADVMTINLHRNIERLVAVLPEARIIHMIRDPRDVARSSIGMGWAGHIYYGVHHWAETERTWEAIAPELRPERVLSLRYEDLFRDLDPTLHRVCEFLGVPFADDMLRYHEGSSYGPPDENLVEQWRRKCARRDLALLEGAMQDLMGTRGYALSGPVAFPSPFERLWLWVRNTGGRWRFDIRRHGFGLFIAEKLTRWLRLRRAWEWVTLRRQNHETRALR